MHVLLIDGFYIFQKKLFEKIDSCSIILPRQKASRITNFDDFETLHLIPDYQDRDYCFALARLEFQRKPFDRVVCFHDEGQEIAQKISEMFNLNFGNPAKAFRETRDKSLMRLILNKSGLENVLCEKISNPEDWRSTAAKFPGKCVIKPADGTGSKGVKILNSGNEIEDYLKSCKNLENIIVESFIEGPEYSVETLSEDGQHKILGIAKKYVDAESNVEIGHVMPAPIPADAALQIKKHIEKALTLVGYQNGPSHIEVKMTNAGPAIIEMHTRSGGDYIFELVHLATGINYADLVAEQATGKKVFNKIPNEIPFKQAAAIWFSIANKSGTLVKLHGFEEAKNALGISEHFRYKDDGAQVHPPKHSFDRVASFVSLGSDINQTLNNARSAANGCRAEIVA